MKRFKTIKAMTFGILVISVLFSVVFGFILFEFSGIWGILLMTLGLFFIIIPIYYLLSYVDKSEKELKKSINVISSEIRHINDESTSKIKLHSGFEAVAISVGEINEKDKERTKINDILNDILICAVRNLELNKFIDSVMDKIMDIISSDWAAFYSLNKVSNKLEIKASKGFSKAIYSQYDISIGEGYIGNAAARNEIKIINDLPDDTVFIANTFLGKIKPKSLIVVPLCDENNEVLGVFVAASLYTYTKQQQEIIDKIKKYISYAIENGNYYNKTLRVANELKFQNQLIQNLNDDLENKIKARTIFLNGIINSIQDTAIISIDGRKVINIFNESAVRMFGIASEDAIDKNIKVIAENNSFLSKRLDKAIDEAISEKNACEIFDMENKEGVRIPVNMNLFTIYNEVGDVDGVTIVIKDMTDINKLTDTATADKKLMSVLFESNTAALVITDAGGKIANINKNALYALGVKEDEALGSKLYGFFEDSEKIHMFIDKTAKGENKSDIETRVTKSGLNVTLLTYPIKNDFTAEVKLLTVLH